MSTADSTPTRSIPMLASGPITVGHDGSTLGKHALKAALKLADRMKAPVVIVRSWSIDPVGASALQFVQDVDAFHNNTDTVLAQLTEDAAPLLAEYPDVEVSFRVELSRPADLLLGAANGARLLVVGSRGLGGFAGLLLGSVSSTVVHRAACPVMIVPPPRHRRSREPNPGASERSVRPPIGAAPGRADSRSAASAVSSDHSGRTVPAPEAGDQRAQAIGGDRPTASNLEVDPSLALNPVTISQPNGLTAEFLSDITPEPEVVFPEDTARAAAAGSAPSADAGKQSSYPPKHPDRIVVGHDGSPAAARALEFALTLAEQMDLGVAVVRSWDVGTPPDGSRFLGNDPESLTGISNQVRAELEAQTAECVAAHPRVDVEFSSEPGQPADVLADAADGAKLLVVGTRGRGGFAGLLLGSTSGLAMHMATCPIVVVPPAHREQHAREDELEL